MTPEQVEAMYEWGEHFMCEFRKMLNAHFAELKVRKALTKDFDQDVELTQTLTTKQH